MDGIIRIYFSNQAPNRTRIAIILENLIELQAALLINPKNGIINSNTNIKLKMEIIDDIKANLCLNLIINIVPINIMALILINTTSRYALFSYINIV